MPTGLFNLKQVNQAISQGAWSGYIAPRWVEYLVVAGGASGGSNNGGGGGAGGLLTGIVTVAAGTSYTVTVGAGGAGVTVNNAGNAGVSSVFGSISATGGGRGGGYGGAATSGGSGGGGGGGQAEVFVAQGTAGQGNTGSAGQPSTSPYVGGGGGGAGTVGTAFAGTAPAVTGGGGGAGIASSISGTVVVYGGGGGGSIGSSGSSAGSGGVGGGGGGATSGGGTATSGGGNTGGGGGGASTGTSGSGGSGIVVVRYPGSVQFFTGGTLSYANGYIIHTFYASGTLAPTTPTPYVTDYQISRSLRFNFDDSAYLNRTPASAGNRTTWTWSAWLKISGLANESHLFDAGDNYLCFYQPNGEFVFYNTGVEILKTTQLFRDFSAWYHIVLAFDTTQATASNRVKLYVNGSQVTTFTAANYPAQNATSIINNNVQHRIGEYSSGGPFYYRGYMTEVNFIDGQALTPSSFGYTDPDTGVWSPLAFVGTYGTNGFYVNFSDNSNTTAATLGKDYSGNGNNWTPNNFSVTAGAGNDSLVDSPTSYGTDTGAGGTVRGNYCTLNPLYKNGAGTPAYTNGNLDMLAGGTGDSYFGGTIPVSSGKWYYECLVNSVASSGGTGLVIGICKTSAPNGTNVGGYRNTSEIYNLDGTTQTAGATYATGDLIGVAIDCDAGTVKFYKNNTGQGATPSFTFTAGTEVFVRGRSDGANPSVTFNFGQRPFAYTAPSGYKALCTQNLPTPTIGATTATQAGKFFNTVLYTGTDSAQTITGVGFQPDYVWLKNRTAANAPKNLDVLRGAGWSLSSAETGAEANQTNAFTAFTSDGFSVATNGGEFNASGRNYVAWNWKANGSGSTNTAGSITSTVSANTTSGFSVVTYTGNGSAGATIGHGLGVAPRMIIIKSRSDVSGWAVYQADVGNTKYLRLDGTDIANTASTLWNNTSPTSSVFSVGTDGWVNTSARTYVAYCFAPIAGYSAFGSYTGNGSTTDGVFIYTGFRPKYIMFKGSSVVTNWSIFDTSRSPYNLSTQILGANIADAEFTTSDSQIDILSNGIKIRSTTTASGINQSGATYIFAAFAETPFKYSLAR